MVVVCAAVELLIFHDGADVDDANHESHHNDDYELLYHLMKSGDMCPPLQYRSRTDARHVIASAMSDTCRQSPKGTP